MNESWEELNRILSGGFAQPAVSQWAPFNADAFVLVTAKRRVGFGQMVTLDDIAPRRFYPDADQEGAE